MRTALAGVVVALAFPVVTAGVSSPDPIVAYPENPVAVGGGDPLRGVPRPDECSSKRDRPGRRDYVRLALLKRARADNPFVTGDNGSIALELRNVKKQLFRLYVSATTPAMVTRFIATSTACYEYFPLAKAPGLVVEAVQFDALLVRAAVIGTGRSQTALATLETISLPQATRRR